MRSLFCVAAQLVLLSVISAAFADAPTTQPAPPAWMAKNPSTWPQMLVTNKITTKDGVGYSGSSSLTRLPNGVIVLATAGHLMDGAKLSDFDSAFKSWIALLPTAPTRGVRMTKVAMDVANPTAMDVLILCPSSQHMLWPAAVLPIRQEPLYVGDVVYLIGIPTQGNPRQTVHKGEVISVDENGQVQFNTDGPFKTNGCSGGPVIDALGQLAGIYSAHLNDQNIPGKMQLVCINASSALQIIKLPPGMKPLVLSTQPTAAGVKAAARASDEMEAEKEFELAEFMLSKGVPPEVIKGQFQEIVDKYPSTAAAKKAKEQLAQMPKS